MDGGKSDPKEIHRPAMKLFLRLQRSTEESSIIGGVQARF